jgi:uncharacterized protein (DUF433 family)
VTREVSFGGKDLFVEANQQVSGGTHFIAITQGAQHVWSPAISRYLETIDWLTGKNVPYQWRPLDGGNVVKLHPEIEFGLPSIRRVRTETLLRRFLGSESVTEIAEDFGLEIPEVEQAIRYEWALTPAA